MNTKQVAASLLLASALTAAIGTLNARAEDRPRRNATAFP